MSDSVSLGAGQYTAKSIDIATREDLDKVKENEYQQQLKSNFIEMNQSL